MSRSLRRLLVCTLALLAPSAAAAQAQGTNTVQTDSVGNPQLRDFELPGNRTTPPAQTPPATAQPPATTPPATSPPGRTPPVQSPPVARPVEIRPGISAQTGSPAPRAPTREAAPAARPRDEAPADAAAPLPAPLPQPTDVLEALPVPAAPTPAPSAAAPTAEVPQAPPPSDKIPWLYIGLGATALLVGVGALLTLRRRRRAEEEDVDAGEEAPAPAEVPGLDPVAHRQPAPAPIRPTADPVPATALPPDGVVGIKMRPWVELEFRPARAAATDTEANVQFELILRNTGSAPAHNVRIEVRMFNAGPEQAREIELFYGEPIRERTPPALTMLPPRGEVQVTSAVALPKDHVREIMVQGRRLFIPTVAFNVVYDWGNGKTGQTSTSYVVGREAGAPSEKMGAFRLDLGPRLYRSVGQRQTSLARLV